MELSRIRELKEKIEEAELDLEDLRRRLESVSSKMERLPKVNSSLKTLVESLAARVIDRERELENLRGELAESVVTLTQEILEQVQGRSAQILVFRYCELKTVKEIAIELHYSETNIYRLHQQIIRQYDSAETKSKKKPRM